MHCIKSQIAFKYHKICSKCSKYRRKLLKKCSKYVQTNVLPQTWKSLLHSNTKKEAQNTKTNAQNTEKTAQLPKQYRKKVLKNVQSYNPRSLVCRSSHNCIQVPKKLLKILKKYAQNTEKNCSKSAQKCTNKATTHKRQPMYGYGCKAQTDRPGSHNCIQMPKRMLKIPENMLKIPKICSNTEKTAQNTEKNSSQKVLKKCTNKCIDMDAKYRHIGWVW